MRLQCASEYIQTHHPQTFSNSEPSPRVTNVAACELVRIFASASTLGALGAVPCAVGRSAFPLRATTLVASSSASCRSLRGRRFGCKLRGQLPLAGNCRSRSPRRGQRRLQAPRPTADRGADHTTAASSAATCRLRPAADCEARVEHHLGCQHRGQPPSTARATPRHRRHRGHLCRAGLRVVKAGPSAKHTRAHHDSNCMLVRQCVVLLVRGTLMFHMRYAGLAGCVSGAVASDERNRTRLLTSGTRTMW